MADELLEGLATCRIAQVQRDAALTAVERLEEQRVLAGLKRRDVAADVAAGFGILDLDHLGAHVGELQRRPRTRPELLDRENANVRQRLRCVGVQLSVALV